MSSCEARFLHGWQNFRRASIGIRETLINTILCSTKKRVYKHRNGVVHKTVGRTVKVTKQHTPPSSHSWEANSSAASQAIPAFYGTWRFITIFTTASHLSLPWATWIRPTIYHFTSVRFISALSHLNPVHNLSFYLCKIHFSIKFHLCLCFPSGLFPSWFPNQNPTCIPLLHTCHMPGPSRPPWFHCPNTQHEEFLTCSIVHSAWTFSSLVINAFLSTLCSKTLSLCSSLNVPDRVSHPYKTKGNITLLNSDTMTTKRVAQLIGSESAHMGHQAVRNVSQRLANSLQWRILTFRNLAFHI